MRKAWCRIRLMNARGFSPVEVLLAATIFGFLVTALVGAFVYGQQSSAQSGNRGRALLLADEGLQAVRNIRDSGFSNLNDGTYGLAQTGGEWALSGSSDTSDVFTRQINIAASGTNRKTITSTVSWSYGAAGTSQVSLTTLLTNWLAPIVQPTSWAKPALTGGLDAAGTNDGLKVATVGNYAYVVRNDGTPDFMVVNISNPAAPTLAGSLNLAGAPTNIAVSGNYAYVSNSSSAAELQVINISNPAAPSLAFTYNAPGSAGGLGVYVSGTTVYLTRSANTTLGTNELLIINAANPLSLLLSGSFNTDVTLREIYVSGNYAFVATDSNAAELAVFNVTLAILPSLAATLDLSGTANALTIAGYDNTVYVGQGAILRSVNVSNPNAPSLLGSVTATGSGIINDITIDTTGSYAFLATAASAAELQSVSITSPNVMSVSGVVNVSGTGVLNGVAHNTSLDVVVGTGSYDTQEIVVFRKGL